MTQPSATGPDFAGEYTPRHCGFCAREFKTRGARVTHENRCWTEQRIRASVIAAVADVAREESDPCDHDWHVAFGEEPCRPNCTRARVQP